MEIRVVRLLASVLMLRKGGLITAAITRKTRKHKSPHHAGWMWLGYDPQRGEYLAAMQAENGKCFSAEAIDGREVEK